MITELFDESLILLKELLCMDMDDIIYLKLKIANPNYEAPDYTKVHEDDKDKNRAWNQLDTTLYRMSIILRLQTTTLSGYGHSWPTFCIGTLLPNSMIKSSPMAPNEWPPIWKLCAAS